MRWAEVGRPFLSLLQELLCFCFVLAAPLPAAALGCSQTQPTAACLQVETQRFNATFARKDERTPLVDFLLLAAAKGKAIYSQAYAELAHQVWASGAGRHEPCLPAEATNMPPPGLASARVVALAKYCWSCLCLPACLQVTQHCEERGRLMADVWIGYAAMLDRRVGSSRWDGGRATN